MQVWGRSAGEDQHSIADAGELHPSLPSLCRCSRAQVMIVVSVSVCSVNVKHESRMGPNPNLSIVIILGCVIDSEQAKTLSEATVSREAFSCAN